MFTLSLKGKKRVKLDRCAISALMTYVPPMCLVLDEAPCIQGVI